jgi:hypothetical protein
MVDEFTSYMIVAISAVALLVFISALRKVVRRDGWSRTATLAAVIATCTQLTVDFLVTYLGKWQRVRDFHSNVPWQWPGTWHQLWRALSLSLGLISAIVFVTRARRHDVPLNIPAVLLATVALVSFASSLLHGDNPFRPVSVVYAVLLIACTVAPRGLGIHVGIATCSTIVALGSGFTFLTFIRQYGFGVFPCTADKCGILDFGFSGVMVHDNALAIYLDLAMPFVYIAFGSWEGVFLTAYMLGLTLMTGSRSGGVAGLITFLALIVIRPNVRKPNAAPVRSWLLHFGLLAALIVGIEVPFLRHDPSAFTGRAYLWSLVHASMSDTANLWYGTGVRGVLHLREAGLIKFDVYSVHNQWMQILFSAGIIGFVLFIVALALMLWNARGRYTLVIGSVLLPAFVLGVTERPWPIDSLDWLPWVMPATLLCYPATRDKNPDSADTESNLAADLRSDNAVTVGNDG